jgi:hypothetical protein
MYDKKFRRVYGPRLPGNSGRLLALIKHAIIKRHLQRKYQKESPYLDTAWKMDVPKNVPYRKFNYLAIVYDNVVQEMIRVDDTTAKYLLGGAELVKYDPELTEVKKEMRYINGSFVEKLEEKPNVEPTKKG